MASSSLAQEFQRSTLPDLQGLGWNEYRYQHRGGLVTIYYVHQMCHITTDVNIRDDPRLLQAITIFVEYHKINLVPPEMELWIRDGEFTERGFISTSFWVHHGKRDIVVKDLELDASPKPGKKDSDEDTTQPDAAGISKYWSFIESHPGHVTLSEEARMEAMDLLAYSWINRETIPVLLQMGESQVLMSLLSSIGSEENSKVNVGIARVFLKSARWQNQFHQDKGLPSYLLSGESYLKWSFFRGAWGAVVSYLSSFRCPQAYAEDGESDWVEYRDPAQDP